MSAPDFNGEAVKTGAEFEGIEEASGLEKARATFAAKLALAGGYVLLRLADGSFLITRWNLTKHCPDLQAVSVFCRQVGAL